MKPLRLLLASVLLSGCAHHASVKTIPPHIESGWNYDADCHGDITPQEEHRVETGVTIELK